MAMENSRNRVKYLQQKLTAKALIDVAYPVFLANTPIKSGNARRHTGKTKSEIIADYPYAKRLDNGWSRQSPGGMVKPAIQAMRDYITKILGK